MWAWPSSSHATVKRRQKYLNKVLRYNVSPLYIFDIICRLTTSSWERLSKLLRDYLSVEDNVLLRHKKGRRGKASRLRYQRKVKFLYRERKREERRALKGKAKELIIPDLSTNLTVTPPKESLVEKSRSVSADLVPKGPLVLTERLSHRSRDISSLTKDNLWLSQRPALVWEKTATPVVGPYVRKCWSCGQSCPEHGDLCEIYSGEMDKNPSVKYKLHVCLHCKIPLIGEGTVSVPKEERKAMPPPFKEWRALGKPEGKYGAWLRTLGFDPDNV
jgi:hypothetical protein